MAINHPLADERVVGDGRGVSRFLRGRGGEGQGKDEAHDHFSGLTRFRVMTITPFSTSGLNSFGRSVASLPKHRRIVSPLISMMAWTNLSGPPPGPPARGLMSIVAGVLVMSAVYSTSSGLPFRSGSVTEILPSA